MTTTAQMSVGIDTSQAKIDLQNLRKEMEGSAHKILISVDPTSVDQDIQRYLKQRSFKIKVDTSQMGREVANDIGVALDRAFNKPDRSLAWNQAALRGGMNAAMSEVFNESGRRLLFDRNRFHDDINEVLRTSFASPQSLHINTALLTTQIRDAVSAGLALARPMPAPLTPAGHPGVAAAVATERAAAEPQGARAAPQIDARALLGLPSNEAVQVAGNELRALARTAVDFEAIRPRPVPTTSAAALLGMPSLESIRETGAALRAEVARAINFEGLQARPVASLAVGAIGAAAGAAPAPAAPLAAAAVAPELVSSVKLTIREVLTPAVDEMVQAATAIAAAARRATAGAGAGGGALKASQSISGKDIETGRTTRVSMPVEEPEKQLVSLEKAYTNARAEKNLILQETEEYRQGLKAKTQAEVMESANQSGARQVAFQRRRSQEAGSLLQETEEYRQGLKAKTQAEVMESANQSGARQVAFQRRRSQEAGSLLQETEEYRQGLKAKTQAEVMESANQSGARQVAFQRRRAQEAGSLLQATEEYRQGLRVKTQAEAMESANQSGARQVAFQRRRAQAAGELLQETEEYKRGLQAKAQAVKAFNDEVSAYYAKAKFEAKASYLGPGPDIAATKATQQKFGSTATLQELGPTKAHLIDEIPNLESHRRKIGEVVSAHGALKLAVSDASSAVRGLAGSMGALWTTYGSVVPLVAAAAIGSALKNVFIVGKDVEYQLAFVSALSDNAAVSMEKFNAAITGSMVAPKQAAEAMRGLAQNGLSVAESLTALPAILSLATVGEMSLSEAALGATGVMAAFNLTVNDLGHVSDVFAKAAAISNTSVQSMVESMKQASVVGDEYHVTIEQTAASLAVLAQRNITGSQAGTSFRNMMSELASPSKKAKDALKQMHLELYDGNKQLLDYDTVMRRLHDTIVVMSDESRNAFMSDVFNKKGDKAVSALISDYELLKQKQDEIKNGSQGFADSVQNILGETTQGKWQKLIAEFDMAADGAFNNASTSAKGFIDQMRLLAGSDAFKSGLADLVSGVVSLTRFLEENAKSIAIVAGGWLVLRTGAGLLVTAVGGLTAAFEAAGIAATGFGLAARVAIGFATGGVGLIAALAAQYLLMRDNTSEADKALKDYKTTIDQNNAQSEIRIKAMQAENAILDIQAKLIWQGVDAVKAKQQAEGEIQKVASRNLQTDLTANKADLASTNAKLSKFTPEINSEGFIINNGEEDKLRKHAAELEAVIKSQSMAVTVAEQTAADARVRDIATSKVKIGTAIQEFNTELAGKLKLRKYPGVTPIDMTAASNMKDADVLDEIKRRRALMSKEGTTYVQPVPGKATPQGANKAQYHGLLDDLNADQKEVEQYIKFRKQLDDAKYNPKLYGDSTAASVQEQRQLTDTTLALKAEGDAINRLGIARAGLDAKYPLPKDKPGLDAAIIGIDNEIAKRIERFKVIGAELEQSKLVAKQNAETREQIEAAELAQANRKASANVDESIVKIRQSYSTKVESPAAAAGTKAATKAEAEYLPIITKQETDVETREAAINRLLADRAKLLESFTPLDTDRLERLDAALGSTRDELTVAQERLATERSLSLIAGAKARTVGTDEFNKSQTAEYGFRKYFEEYQSSAQSSAQIVQDLMKKSTDGMSASFGNFVTGAKSGFKSMVASLLADAARAMANKALSSLLGMVVNYALGAAGGGGGLSTEAYQTSGFNTAPNSDYSNEGGNYKFAHGGVMTGDGPVELKKYANGGVAHGTQIEEFGESSLPEANVPLADGRSIPVTLQGGQGGGGDTSVNIAVNIDSNGKSQVESDSSGKKAGQLGKMVEDSVLTVIQREKRPGGLLYA